MKVTAQQISAARSILDNLSPVNAPYHMDSAFVFFSPDTVTVTIDGIIHIFAISYVDSVTGSDASELSKAW